MAEDVPTCWLVLRHGFFQGERAVFQDLQFRTCFLPLRTHPVISARLPPTLTLHIDAADEVLETFDILYISRTPWSLPCSSSAQGLLPFLSLVASLIVVKKVSTSPVGIGKTFVRNHFAWLQPMPQRRDPAASLAVISVLTPAAKTFAAFFRHTLADSNAQIPCTTSAREALTVVAKVCDCERSNLLWLPMCSSSEAQHVPHNDCC